MNKIKSGSQSRLDRLYRHAENFRNQDNFEDDFTILEVAFSYNATLFKWVLMAWVFIFRSYLHAGHYQTVSNFCPAPDSRSEIL